MCLLKDGKQFQRIHANRPAWVNLVVAGVTGIGFVPNPYVIRLINQTNHQSSIMSEHLFLNINGDLKVLSEKIFNTIGLGFTIMEGDSANVKDGVYYSLSILGMVIKIEYNSYDYDDVFNLMISIQKDIYSDILIDEIRIRRFTEIFASLLAKNMGIKITHEDNESNLQYYEP